MMTIGDRSMWTYFMDMHSGGGTKVEPYEHIFIEAAADEARVIFYNRFKRNPDRVTCTCCGSDYSVTQSPDLADATGFQRGCEYVYFSADGAEHDETYWYSLPIGERNRQLKGRYVERANTRFRSLQYQSLEDYMKRPDVMFIPASHIEPHERVGKVPQQGFVWVGDDE